MTLLDLLGWMGRAQLPLMVVGVATPALLWAWGRFSTSPRTSRAFGHVASALIALGLCAMVADVVIAVFFARRGTDLAQVPLVGLVLPFWFGLGCLWGATRAVPFEELKRYPLLRRVWATLTLAAVLIAVLLVLKHTYLLVFTSVLGFVVLAIIAWVLISKLTGRVADPPPEGGDPDLIEDVARESRRRLADLAARTGGFDEEPKK